MPGFLPALALRNWLLHPGGLQKIEGQASRSLGLRLRVKGHGGVGREIVQGALLEILIYNILLFTMICYNLLRILYYAVQHALVKSTGLQENIITITTSTFSTSITLSRVSTFITSAITIIAFIRIICTSSMIFIEISSGLELKAWRRWVLNL